MNSLKIIPRKQIGKERWDGFALASGEAWFWHRYDFTEALTTWPGRSNESFALVKEEGASQIQAIVPLYLVKRKIAGPVFYIYLDCFGGPAFVAGMDERSKQIIFEHVRDHLVRMAKVHHACEIRFVLAALTPFLAGENRPHINPLAAIGCVLSQAQTWVLSLKPGLELIWNNMEGRARTVIRKAERSGVTVRPASSAQDLDTYYQLHCQTYKRTHTRPHPKEYFRNIWEKLLGSQAAYVIFAQRQGRVVAAANFGLYKKSAIYWTGASTDEGLSLGANSLLQWEGIKWMKTRQVDWYEVGEAYLNPAGKKARGLSDFKKSFGGTLFPYYKGKIFTGNKLFSTMALLRSLLNKA